MSYQTAFFQACATGDKKSVCSLLPNMKSSDLSTVVAGIEQIVANGHVCTLSPAFKNFYSGNIPNTLLLLSMSFLQSNFLAAEFIIDEILPENYAAQAMSWLFHSGKTRPDQQRHDVALFLLNKNSAKTHHNLLMHAVREGDPFISQTLYNALPGVGVDSLANNSVDVWPGIVLCTDVIMMDGLDNYDEDDSVRRCSQILDILLARLDFNHVQCRLEQEVDQDPDFLERSAIVTDRLQELQKSKLELCVLEVAPAPKSQYLRKM